VPLFEKLNTLLAADGIDLDIVAGTPRGDQGLRGDSLTPSWLRQVDDRSIRLGARSIDVADHHKAWAESDAVIVGLVGSSISANRAVLESIRGTRKVGLWGHVKSYVSRPNAVDALVERWQMRHADHVFAYTQVGADFAAKSGVPRARISPLMNTIDTASLAAARDQLSPADMCKFSEEHSLTPGKVLAYVGGFDASKRVDFLARSLDTLYGIDPRVKILAAGQGAQFALLNSAIERGQVIPLGYIGNLEKALIGRTASGLISPGRIGLLAVEALVLGLPVITTDWPYHAPEAEYLREGISRLTAPNEEGAFGAFLAEFSARPRTSPNDVWSYPTLESMVSKFHAGVVIMLNSSR
jgi:glycosyltransferase involved in cell wall biosynthesis